jgi:hypothetical protein
MYVLTTWSALMAEFIIYSLIFPITTVLQILNPVFATILNLGIFHEICFTALKTQLIFKHLNRMIRASFSTQYESCVDYILFRVKKGDMCIYELSKLRRHHELLCCAIQKMNSGYQPVVFISTAFYMLEVTFSLYKALLVFIVTVRAWDTQTIIIFIIANLLWAILLMYNFAHLAWQCEKLATEV